MRQEITRILSVVLAMLLVAALWGLASVRISGAQTRSEPQQTLQTRNEPSHA